MRSSVFVAIVCLGVGVLTLANYMNWQRQRQAERELITCIREYRLLLEEHPCPVAR